MITTDEKIDFPETYPLHNLGRPEELLFFDIETTGFSGEYTSLYLIGCVYMQDGSWHLRQWFADTPQSEPQILHEFFRFLSGFCLLIHFNGDGFDIPYLLKRCRFYQLPYDFSSIKSYDIYKRIKPYRHLLGLDSLKQKSIERFLGIFRKDMYSGGQLVEVYKDYLISREPVLYDMLMLHNAEDLKGMPLILPILYYPDFLEHGFSLDKQELLEYGDIFGGSIKKLCLTCKSPYHLPVPFERERGCFLLEAGQNCLNITIDLYEGCLKYFYPNYKDYYYLIYEDTAIHKSIGEYVDKSVRQKATAKTCYTRLKGCFLPQTLPIWEPALKKDYKDKLTYVEYKDNLFLDKENLDAYLLELVSYLNVKPTKA